MSHLTPTPPWTPLSAAVSYSDRVRRWWCCSFHPHILFIYGGGRCAYTSMSTAGYNNRHLPSPPPNHRTPPPRGPTTAMTNHKNKNNNNNNAGPPIHSPYRRTNRIDKTTTTTTTAAATAAAAASGHHQVTPVRPYRGNARRNHRRHHYPSSSQVVARADSLLLPFDEYVGWMSPWAWLWGSIFLTIPLAYVYIVLVLIRELCRAVPALRDDIVRAYVPFLHVVLDRMRSNHFVGWWIEVWCTIEAVFFVVLKLHTRWLGARDTLEASLSAAPLMDLTSRRVLWQRMMETEADDTASWIRGWLLDSQSDVSAMEDLSRVSESDLLFFVCWSLFEGRRIEHLTTPERKQLESFVHEIQIRLSLQFYGAMQEEEEEEEGYNGDHNDDNSTHGEDLPAASHDSGYDPWKVPRFVCLPQPKKIFTFRQDEPNEEHSFFADLYETYRRRYERMREADFSPVQDLAHRLAAPVQHFVHEGLHTAESSSQYVYETLVPQEIDERLTAVRQATYAQMIEAWNSVKTNMRLETARFLSHRRQDLQQQLKGYQHMLHRMLENSHAADIPRQQMAILMRRITECNEALEGLERRAQSAFVQATGFAMKNLAPFLPKVQEPRRFATYSADPLLGIATYPLGFHLLILALTEIPLRFVMARKGFVKKRIGPVSYWYHPGKPSAEDHIDSYHDDMTDDASEYSENTDGGVIPIVFVHGIGIGLIAYLPLVDALLKTGRPLFLPEIPYVSGFRPWQSPNCVLGPQVVTSSLSAMLASHGFLRATFMGHSYGTSWLSYMCKYAEHAVAALCFLDPICFCLHAPRLTKSFVYTRPDPGTIAYIVRTDIIVNWTIQRSFPWAWIVLFIEQIKVPTTIFLSEKDALVPADKVESYLRDRQVPLCDFDRNMSVEHFESESVVNGCIFRGDGHGAWTEKPSVYVPMVATATEILCRRASNSSG